VHHPLRALGAQTKRRSNSGLVGRCPCKHLGVFTTAPPRGAGAGEPGRRCSSPWLRIRSMRRCQEPFNTGVAGRWTRMQLNTPIVTENGYYYVGRLLVSSGATSICQSEDLSHRGDSVPFRKRAPSHFAVGRGRDGDSWHQQRRPPSVSARAADPHTSFRLLTLAWPAGSSQ